MTFGLGLRPTHYHAVLETRPKVDFFEVISENYLIPGGKPRAMLEKIRADYPIVMHGVSLSIAAPQAPDWHYLKRLRALMREIEPAWVSDHLCWTGAHGKNLHDLLPLPYTEESLAHVIRKVRQVQDFLGRTLLLENPSTYLEFAGNTLTESAFLRELCTATGCGILLDVNNLYVNQINHGHDARAYLSELPADHIQQIHLAGHTDNGDHLIDTHDHPVSDPVWDLYAHCCTQLGSVPTMIERDDHIPPLPELLAELERARHIGAQAQPTVYETAISSLQNAILVAPEHSAVPSEALKTLVVNSEGLPLSQRLDIYRHAYRVRLQDTLADSFERTHAWLGDENFYALAQEYIAQKPPTEATLRDFGADFPTLLTQRFTNDKEIGELATLDWALRNAFDAADASQLRLSTLADEQIDWDKTGFYFWPALTRHRFEMNTLALWHAMNQGETPPACVALETPADVLVWRKEWQPQFVSLTPLQSDLFNSLQQGKSWGATYANAVEKFDPETAAQLGTVLAAWVENGLITGLRSNLA